MLLKNIFTVDAGYLQNPSFPLHPCSFPPTITAQDTRLFGFCIFVTIKLILVNISWIETAGRLK